MISLSGAVDEQVDWDAAGIDCSGSAVTALTLGWASPDLELRLAQIPLGGGETGSGLPATLAINVAETSYSTERKGCTVDISSNEPVNEFVHLVEGSGSCGPLTEIGGDGTITVDGDFSFATYVLV